MDRQRRVRDLGGALRFAHLRSIGVPLDELDRLIVATGTTKSDGVYVEAETSELRHLHGGELVPFGTWIARQDIVNLVEAGESDVESTLKWSQPAMTREKGDEGGDEDATR